MINSTINSVDPEHYNRINITLPNNTNWQHAMFTATSLVTQCNMIVLDANVDMLRIVRLVPKQGDAFMVDEACYRIIITQSYRNFDSFEEVMEMLNHFLEIYECPVRAGLTYINTIILYSTDNQNLYINDMTYNLRILTGFYANYLLPTTAVLASDFDFDEENDVIKALACGFLVRTQNVSTHQNMTVFGNKFKPKFFGKINFLENFQTDIFQMPQNP
jgi:hypothetical protein